jgi:SAM-dependent methyltransferase
MSTVQFTPRTQRPRQQPAGQGVKTCDLCDGTRFDLVGQHDRHGNVLHTGICLRCGLVCHMAIPSEQQLAEFYAKDYRREYHGEIAPSARRVARAWKNAQRIYRQLAPHVRPTDKVFEVGAGIGCNVKVFELHGHDASGIDPNEGFCDYSVKSLKTRLTQGDLFHLAPQPRFDLVLLVHVIEHFRSPRRALEHIRGLLRPGGRLYVECPNLAAPFARPGRMFHIAHIHNFTPASLRMMARRCGFDVEHTFSDGGDPNLQMLWQRRETPEPLEIDASNVTATLAALHKYNVLTYHLRRRYLAERVPKLCGYLGEHLLARRRVRRLIEQCHGLVTHIPHP